MSKDLPELPSATWRKKVKGRGSEVDWEATAQRFEGAFTALRGEANARIADLEKRLSEARALAEEQSAEVREATRVSKEGTEALRTMLAGNVAKETTIAALRSRIETLLGAIGSLSRSGLEPGSSTYPPAGGVHLPWGEPEHTGGKEISPEGPIRTWLIRHFVALWMMHSNRSSTFATFAKEVIEGAARAYPPPPSKQLSDTNLARYLAVRLGKTFPF